MADYKDSDWITIQEAADLLRVKYMTVWQWVNRGKLPVNRIGRTIRIEVGELKSAMKKHVA